VFAGQFADYGLQIRSISRVMRAMSNPDEFLLSLFRSLPGAEQATLLAFAEFLHSRSGGQALQSLSPEPAVIPEPEPIPRPPQESVIKAVKRLSQTYHMLDKNKMLKLRSVKFASVFLCWDCCCSFASCNFY